MVDMTFGAYDTFEDAGHSNLNWHGRCSINKTKQNLLRAVSQAFYTEVLWQKVAGATRKAISCSKLSLFELRGGSSSQMNCFKSIFRWIYIQWQRINGFCSPFCDETTLQKVYFKLIIVLKSSERKTQSHRKHKGNKQCKIREQKLGYEITFTELHFYSATRSPALVCLKCGNLPEVATLKARLLWTVKLSIP